MRKMTLLMLLAGCAPQLAEPTFSEDQTGRELRLTPSTIILDEASVTDVQVFDDQVVLAPAAYLDVGPGSILVGMQDGGILREVVDVQQDGDLIIADTILADLSDIIASGTMQADVDLSERSELSFYIPPINLAARDGASIDITGGYITVNPSFRFTVASDHWNPWQQTSSASADVTVTNSVGLSASVVQGFQGGDERVLVDQSRPFAFAVGPVPVAGRVNIRAVAGYHYEAVGAAEVSYTGTTTTTMTTQATYNNGWSQTGDIHNTPGHSVNYYVHTFFQGDAYVRVEVEAILYETLAMEVNGQAGLTSTICPTGVYVDAVADANITAGVGWFNHTLWANNYNLWSYSYPLAGAGNCF